jgi:hypothetical protein
MDERSLNKAANIIYIILRALCIFAYHTIRNVLVIMGAASIIGSSTDRRR